MREIDNDMLAQALYEAQFATPQVYPFIEWNNLNEQTKGSYLVQARTLSKRFHITPRMESD